MLAKLRSSTEKRFNDIETKKRTYVIQYVSAVIFISCGFFLPLKFLVFFLSEGIGQIFLAYNNQRTMTNGNPRIIYFDSNVLGFFAGVSFSVTAVVRLMSFAPIISCVLALAYIISYFKFRRKDEVGFIWVTGSALITAVLTTVFQTELEFGYTQYAYALLLSLGVVFLKAWIAEILNIFIWLWLFWILFF